MDEVTEILKNLDWSPLYISLKTGVAATVISFFLGIFAAGKAVKASPGKKAVLDGILTLPMVMPPTVAGFFLLLLFSRRRPVGAFLFEEFGFKVVQTWIGCVIAAIVISFPLIYLNMTLNEYPYSIEHWNELGKCHLQQCQYEEANEALDFALAIDDENTDSLTLKAFGYHQAGNLKESCDYYLRLANVSKNKTKAYLALAQIYLEMRDHASAISYIEKLINRKSGLTDYELAELYSDTARCHAYLGHTENGYKYINQALELNEHDAEIRIAAGRFFTIEAQKSDISEEEQENNLRNAEHQFTRALEFTPKEERFDVLFKIGSLYFDEHNFEYANQYFELINKEFPEDADATYFFLAYGYYHQQESASFMHYLAKIRKEIPDMYATMGTGDTILMTDTYFNEALRAIKEDVSTGKINLNKYL